jgi:hypothetical protein
MRISGNGNPFLDGPQLYFPKLAVEKVEVVPYTDKERLGILSQVELPDYIKESERRTLYGKALEKVELMSVIDIPIKTKIKIKYLTL